MSRFLARLGFSSLIRAKKVCVLRCFVLRCFVASSICPFRRATPRTHAASCVEGTVLNWGQDSIIFLDTDQSCWQKLARPRHARPRHRTDEAGRVVQAAGNEGLCLVLACLVLKRRIPMGQYVSVLDSCGACRHSSQGKSGSLRTPPHPNSDDHEGQTAATGFRHDGCHRQDSSKFPG